MDGDTRETIRAVALELFSDKGFEQTSLREIAERVGLTKASLYYHYPSKQALLLAVVEPVISGWRSIVDDTARLERNADTVRAVVLRCLDVFLRNRPVAGIFQRDAAGVALVLGALWDDMMDLGKRLVEWLAGPSPTAVQRLRAIAAMEVLGAVLSSATHQDAGEFTEDEMRTVLSEAAMDVLRLTAEPAASGVRKPR
jgi:AcrR family transcriptional regulator